VCVYVCVCVLWGIAKILGRVIFSSCLSFMTLHPSILIYYTWYYIPGAAKIPAFLVPLLCVLEWGRALSI
jgi:hypothetical protein